MKIGIPREIIAGENRVALIPGNIQDLASEDFQVVVENDAGKASGFSDEDYTEAGASIADSPAQIYGESDLVIKVNTLSQNKDIGKHEAEMLGENTAVIGMLDPLHNTDVIRKLANNKVTAFSMEFLPRITRAQNMDILSSMSTVAGYKAGLMAAESLPKFFPLLMTAAGTIPPANALIIGAGVAGLQAIATCKRLGAKVAAFDTRPAVKEQVESLGARFIEMELPEDAETEGGYAKEITEEFYQKELEAIGKQAKRMDVIITTALIFGKKAPILVTEDMLKSMANGSVVIDLAGINGGNCEAGEPGETVEKYGVTIHTPLNLPSELPQHASQMFSKNISNFLDVLYKEDSREFNFDDQIVSDTCMTDGGDIRNEMVRNAVNEEGE
ncbi:MAG: Re/Si-specific NAD(P)(+) transhydrogenase subunit alpha [Candidatus Marinimicrobia bacterium]|nr:Re/Si-specific NAD(P)(+) transhydrogenase subunit alpha [Candidatus Neomarinimicrobiota bacterium]MCF7828363.1 Re/Si-specific NAD(P)(+) transhydrogenase subunit alpha [Candidatus Neomarinimicrobiota bacterium]MCF7881044.1 Re/Si-specific NAD(P)(+) transhydrogenase subunit alpha [Candidatus Neomarinimicrobiota bacterium]